jgi:hypothetical protein
MRTSKKQKNETKQVRFEEETIRIKPKEKYEKELKEVLEKLLKKYYEFIELFVKKEYRLPQHGKELEVKINLKPGFEPPAVKQFHKSRAELKVEDEFGRLQRSWIHTTRKWKSLIKRHVCTQGRRSIVIICSL